MLSNDAFDKTIACICDQVKDLFTIQNILFDQNLNRRNEKKGGIEAVNIILIPYAIQWIVRVHRWWWDYYEWKCEEFHYSNIGMLNDYSN